MICFSEENLKEVFVVEEDFEEDFKILHLHEIQLVHDAYLDLAHQIL